MTDNKPLISVIVPVYNVEKYLNECVDSILAQTYENLEIILVDDGSKDNSPKLCDEYAAKYPNIRAIHKQNGGASSARNVGIDASNGKFLAFLDSDDVFDIDMISKLFEKQCESGAQMVCSGFKALNGTRSLRNPITSDTIYSGYELAAKMFVTDLGMSSCAKIIDRHLIGDNRFPEGILNEDFAMMLDLYLKNPKVYFMVDCFYYYRFNENSTTSVIGERTFDLLTTAIDAEKKVVTLSSELRTAARVCKLRRHIDIAYRLRRDKATKQFPKELQTCYKMMYSNLFFIILSSKVNLRYKIKTMLNILHIPVKERQSVLKARAKMAKASA
jgi:glycosyltransferase involved in cell wall biosynthesis